MNWFLMILPWAAVNFVAYFGASAIALFARPRLGLCDNGKTLGIEPRLPDWLGWFQTFDNSLLGDWAWKNMTEDHWAWRERFAGWPALQAYIGRVGWLMRNPAYGFERTVLAATILPSDIVTYIGNPFVQNSPNGKEGYCYIKIADYWNLVFIKRIGSRCLKINLGWKLKTYAEKPSRIGTQPIAQYVLSPRIASFSTSLL